ncbi:MAG: hypothetical protein ACHQIL_00010 [Steroidobacterales bacterium]
MSKLQIIAFLETPAKSVFEFFVQIGVLVGNPGTADGIYLLLRQFAGHS